MIRDAALIAARRTEGYKFRYGPGVVVDNKGTRIEYDDNQTYFGPKISHEMQLLANERLELYTRKEISIWDDRNSRIAKPWGSEVYLTNDRGNNILGAPRYYQDDMNDDSQLPDARTRFPYSNEANEAAKKITLLFTDIIELFKYFDALNNILFIVSTNVRRGKSARFVYGSWMSFFF
jgi:hypothetical protein